MKTKCFHCSVNRRVLARIERKCDAILALLRPRTEDRDIDRGIDIMHEQARRMKAMAIEEARRYNREQFSPNRQRR